MELLSSIKELSLSSKFHLNTILFLTLLAIYIGYLKLIKAGSKNLPPGTFGYPFLGETISFLRAQKQDRTIEWIQTRVRKYGPVFKTSLMGCNAVVLTGQSGNKFVLSGGDNGISASQIATAKAILGPHSIFEKSGSRHKLVRGAMMQFLKAESIQRLVNKMDAVIQQQLLQEVDGKDSVHIVPLIKKITFKVTCSLLFGLPEGREKDLLFEDFSIALKGLWALPLNFPGTAYNQALRGRLRIAILLTSLMDQTRKQLKEGTKGEHDDMISTMVSLRDENGEALLEEEIVDNMITLIIASHDTATILISLLIRHLARDTDVCNKVYQEQKRVAETTEGSEGNRSWREVQGMQYTRRVAQELMRITPPVFGNFKLAWRDTNFEGYDIPKGWQVFWMSPATHMDEKIFKDPEKFEPARFEDSSKLSTPYTYIPFGAGPRICPGAEFAKVEVLLLIHHLITKYQWKEMVLDEPITRNPMPYPAMGLPVKLQRRNNA